MAFWSAGFEAVKQFQFRIFIGGLGGYLWKAKRVTLPSFEIGEELYQLVNQRFKYAGILTWNDVTFTVVEDGNAAQEVMSFLAAAGYACPGETCSSGISRDVMSATPMIIQQLDPNGTPKQNFELQNWWIKSVNFGDMGYENDGFVDVEFTIGYDCAIIGDRASLTGGG
tara:strand:- start:356 stop:862 length:507 start_codon:yes stop_codon:yes gene_type:complete